MPNGIMALALGAAMQVGIPGPNGVPGPMSGYGPTGNYGPVAPAPMAGYGLANPGPMGAPGSVGAPGPSEAPNFPPLRNAYSQSGAEGQYEQRFPFDTQQNWVHGYFQEIPAYGGHVFFRPYNYKDILSQSQVSAGWGQSPVLPYSQQFWHRYHDQATMLKLSANEGWVPPAPAGPGQAMYIPTGSSFVRQPGYGTPMTSQLPAQPQPPLIQQYYALPPESYPVQEYQSAPVVNESNLQGPALQPALPAPAYQPGRYAPR